MASIEDVARRARVSPITVSRVARDLDSVSQATRERVQQAIADLHYIPNARARGLKQAKSGLIALIITDITSPFFTAVARGAEDAARAAGFSLVLGNSDEDAAIEARYLRVLGEQRVDGVILVPTPDAGDALNRGLPAGIPVVLIDRGVPGVAVDVVRCDTAAGTLALCRHLIGLGHRRIALVGNLSSVPTWDERVGGYRAALSEAALPWAPHLEVTGDRKGRAREAGGGAVRQLLALGGLPDAIIAANAQVGLGVLDELSSQGCRVPEDVGVATIDDPFPQSRGSAFWRRLTVVEQPGYEMGKTAAELLVERVRNARLDKEPRLIVFDPVLKIGVSCGEESKLPL